jgi:hypothetical protein
VAVSRAFLFDKVNFDYIFAQDFRGIAHVQQELVDYKGNNCVKFLGTEENTGGGEIPESFAIKCNAIRYNSDFFATDSRTQNFSLQIEATPTGSLWSTAFPAIQFILYTNPKKIYIVGCDTSSAGHFSNQNLTETEENKMIAGNWQLKEIVKNWLSLKEFASIYYPDTEIISINPIALKNLFKDIYTESYLSEHPDVMDNNLGRNK